jgi:hypothetical protein
MLTATLLMYCLVLLLLLPLPHQSRNDPHHITAQEGEELLDIMHLGVNCANSNRVHVALNIFSRTQATLRPQEALEILYTAVERHQDFQQLGDADVRPTKPLDFIINDLGVVMGSSLRSGLNAAPLAQLMPVLQHAAQLDAAALPDIAATCIPLPNAFNNVLGAGESRTSRLFLLARLPAFHQLTSEQLASLLEVAVRAGDDGNVCVLHTAPAFGQLDAATLCNLLELAVKEPCFEGRPEAAKSWTLHLLQSPRAAEQLTDGGQLLLPVLLAALSAWPVKPDTRQPGGSAAQFLFLGENPGFMGSLRGSVTSRAQQKMSTTVLLELMKAAVQASNMQAFAHLWQLPAAADLSGKQLGQVLSSAAAYGLLCVVEEVLEKHNAWATVGAADKMAAMQAKLQQFMLAG